MSIDNTAASQPRAHLPGADACVGACCVDILSAIATTTTITTTITTRSGWVSVRD